MNDSRLDQLPWEWRVTGQVETCKKRGREERKKRRREEEMERRMSRIHGMIALSGHPPLPLSCYLHLYTGVLIIIYSNTLYLVVIK